MKYESNTAAAQAEGVAAPVIASDSELSANRAALSALCVIARLHHIAVDPAHVAHQLGWSASHEPSIDDLLLAAKHIDLKAKLSRSTIDRLTLAPLPALALLKDPSGRPRIVVLAQCDGQRVLIQDPGLGER